MSSTLSPPDSAPRAAVGPPFEPHPILRGGHRQTIVGRYWPWPRPRLASTYSEVPLSDGDALSILESVPAGWQPGDPTALLIHGLGGCARSPYMIRVAHRLVRRLGIRVVRMNLRGAGSGFGRARSFYHSGRTSDVRAVATALARRTPGSPLALVGFSLGANLALKLAGEAATEPVVGLDAVVAANPPVDLAACARAIQEPGNRLYDRNFVRLLRAEVIRLHARFPDLGAVDLRAARSLHHFDEVYTAPRNGFRGAPDYYAQSSANRSIPQIRVAGLVIHAADDPFIPAESFAAIHFPPSVQLEIVPHGGHLGYLNRHAHDGDRRWLDARIATWLASHWQIVPTPR